MMMIGYFNSLNLQEIFNLDESFESNLFLGEEHETAFQIFLTRGTISHRFVHFEYLETHGVFISKLFENMHWKLFCSMKEETFSNLENLFYLNLHFSNRDSFVFTFQKQHFTVTVVELLENVKTPLRDFIKVSFILMMPTAMN